MTQTMTATRDFSKATIKALRAQGIAIAFATWIPGTDGTYANGERAYMLSNGCLRTHAEVIALAAVAS